MSQDLNLIGKLLRINGIFWELRLLIIDYGLVLISTKILMKFFHGCRVNFSSIEK